MRARIVGISFAVEPGEAAYVPLAHNYPGAPEQLPLDAVLARAASPGSRTSARAKVGQNIKYDSARARQPRHRGARLARTTRCCRATCSRRTAGTAWKAWPSATSSRKGLSYEEVCGKGANQIAFAQVDIAARHRILAARTAR